MIEEIVCFLVCIPIAVVIAGLGNPGGFIMMCDGLRWLWKRLFK